MAKLIPIERIENKIYLIRGKKVMLDADLAKLYGVETRQLKRAVKRNKKRFPVDFMFVLNNKEIDLLVCHFGTPFRSCLGGARPFAFTEYGILMLSSVLRSERAIQVNIQIMRTFTKLRKILSSDKEILKKINAMENKYDSQFRIVFDAIRKLMIPPEKQKNRIGFLRGNK